MAAKRKNIEAKIVSNKPVCPGYWEMTIKTPESARVSCSSGQFFLLTVPGIFLRRPFSIYSADKAAISFLYKVIGKGTENLSKLKAGEQIMVLGPLGSGYELMSLRTNEPILVAGGTGIASLNYLAQNLSKPGILFYGARNKKEIVCLNSFKKSGWKINIATDDGSFGTKGFVTELFEKYVSENSNITVYSCGPHVMLEKIAAISKKYGVKGYVSMEEMMACGVGNCQGCAVKTINGNKMACKDGPVFKMDEIIWE